MFLLMCAGLAGLELFFFDFLLEAEPAAEEAPRDPFGLEGRDADFDEDRDGALEEGAELPEHEERAGLGMPILSSVSMDRSVRKRDVRRHNGRIHL